jgi:hypothetical protein
VSDDGTTLTLNLYTRYPGKDTLKKLAVVTVTKTDRGPALSLDEYNIAKPLQGKGAATRGLAAMLSTAARLGVVEARTGAVGCGPKSHENEGKKYKNGYYTWPLLGFDRAFTDDDTTGLATLPAEFRGAKRLSDILSAPGGTAVWKDYGWSVSCKLALARPDTPGSKLLFAYLAAKSARADVPAKAKKAKTA